MTDWTVVASLATAGGTLVLAGATFAAVRSANRAARATERALLAGIRPVLTPSRPTDPAEKVGFADDHWFKVPGGRAIAEVTDDAVYLAIALRNVGSGLAVLDRWNFHPERSRDEIDFEATAGYRRLTRDLYIAGGDLGFWQGAFREADDPMLALARDAITARQPMTVDLLYGDHEGGQRTVTRFAILPAEDGSWFAAVARHWTLDQPGPR